MTTSKSKYQVGKMKPDMATFKRRKGTKEHPVESQMKKEGVSKKGSKAIRSILKGRS